MNLPDEQMRPFFQTILYITLVASSCSEHQPPKGVMEKTAITQEKNRQAAYQESWNIEREKRHITPYYQNLTGQELNNGFLLWTNNQPANKPGHMRKQMQISAQGTPLFEKDVFYSGKKWSTPGWSDETDIPEELSVEYYYDTTTFNKSGADHICDRGSIRIPWQCVLRINHYKQCITIEQADSVLQRWGINRLKP